MKLNAMPLSKFRQVILNSLPAHKLAPHFSASFFKVVPVERVARLQQLCDSLAQKPDRIFRGTIGPAEIRMALKTNFLGRDFEKNSKEVSLDLIDFVRTNNSRLFLSASPCPHTIRPYAAGLSILPCTP